MMTDAELLRRATKGDEYSFQTLYLRYRDPLYRFAFGLLGIQAASEDVVQECFLGLLTRPAGFSDDRGTLRAYLFGTVRNLAFRLLREKGREQSIPVHWDPVSESTPLDLLLREQTRQAVQEAVSHLPLLQREALILFEYEGLELAEVARIVETETGTVKARLSRARAGLRRALVNVAIVAS